MRYKELGKTGVKVSILGFGGIPIRRISSSEAVKVVNRSLDLGVNFIHTSVTYGDSAEKIGKVLQERRDECILAVKVGGGRTKADAQDRLRTSLETLGVDHIEIAELPINALDFPKAMGADGAYEAFLEAKEEGVIDHIGITSHDVEFLTEAIKTEKFSNVVTPFSYAADMAREELIPLAAELNLGVIAMKVLGVGGLPEAQKALKYVWSHDVDTAIIGMNKISEVERNVETATNTEPLTLEEHAMLQEIAERIYREGRLSGSGRVSHATKIILTNRRGSRTVVHT